jgi:peptidoglycan/LPS O-acetylase OafA/YrhL
MIRTPRRAYHAETKHRNPEDAVKLGQAFDPRHNALNAWRLILATGVIFWHSFPLTGRTISYEPVVRLLSEAWVDGFFTVSGFLITASWMRRPHLKEFWTARVLRIFPGLWVCLLVIAFVIAPIAAAIQHRSIPMSSEVAYVLYNAVMFPYYVGINGTPIGVPWPGVWNGSLWTLLFELLCYIAVCVLGILGLLKRRWVIPVLFVLAVAWCGWVSYPTAALQTIPQMLARFAVVFLAGALLYQFQDKVPARWSLVALSVAIVVASGLLQNYRVIAALPLAYAIIVSGALIRNVQLRNDLSYGVYIYAFPIQQLLATCGLARLDPFVFFAIATAATVPLAALSWFLVERHAMSLKRRIERKSDKPTTASAAKTL